MTKEPIRKIDENGRYYWVYPTKKEIENKVDELDVPTTKKDTLKTVLGIKP
jgi:hypothetical protein